MAETTTYAPCQCGTWGTPSDAREGRCRVCHDYRPVPRDENGELVWPAEDERNGGGVRMAEAKHIALLVEVPAIYTADIGELREFKVDESESDFLSNCIGEPSIVRLRVEVSGEKDSTIEEVWGLVREVQLVEPGRGYGPDPTLTDEQLAEHGFKLMRDEDACEWCQYHEPAEGGES